MAAMQASPVPSISPAEMQILVSRAGLVLNPGQVADLVLAWRQIAGLIAGLRHNRPLADDLAFVFRLPPPASAGGAAPASPPARKRGAAPKRKLQRKTSAKPKPAKAKARVRKSPAKAKKTRRASARRR